MGPILTSSHFSSTKHLHTHMILPCTMTYYLQHHTIFFISKQGSSQKQAIHKLSHTGIASGA